MTVNPHVGVEMAPCLVAMDTDHPGPAMDSSTHQCASGFWAINYIHHNCIIT